MNLLINPPSMIQCGYTPPPLGLLYLAGIDPETEILDVALLNVQYVFHPKQSQYLASLELKQRQPRVVGVPIYTPGRHDSLAYLKLAKEAGAITVAGGPHVAVMLDQLVAHYGDFIDHFVVGDGELAWKALCEGQSLPQVIHMRVEDLDSLPLPAWERIDLHAYPPRGWGTHRGNDLTRLPRVSVVAGRGCSGHCTFCSAWWVNGKPRAHGPAWLDAHFRKLWDLGARHLVFQDDCLTFDREATLALCEVLSHYQFSWFGTTRADCLHLDLAERMRDVGCYELTFGIESGSQTLLDKMHKTITPEAALRARRICKLVGIKFTALMIEGFPYQTPETRAEDARFREQLQPDEWGSLGHTAVLPGTALYQACKRAGLIDDDFWLGDEPYYIYHGGLSDG